MDRANTSAVMRLPKPRDLTDKETADSLEHWITQFTVYIQRDTYMNPFLTRTWNPAAQHRAQAVNGDISAEDMSAYNILFLKLIPLLGSNKKITQKNFKLQNNTGLCI